MKKQVVSRILLHLWRGALLIVLLVALIQVIPIAFGQRNLGRLTPGVSHAPAATGAPGVAASADASVVNSRGNSPVTSLDSWAVRAPFPYNARGPFAVGDGTGVVYVGGGYDGTNVHTETFRYDPAANTFTPLAPSPDSHMLSQAVISNNKIYNIAGFNLGGQSTTTRIYDIASNTWTTGAPIPEPNGLADHATALWNGKIYIAGGYNGSGAISTLRIYDIASNTWTTGASMPAALYLPGFGAINGKIYVASGNNGSTEVNTLYIYDVASNTWTTGATVPTPTTGPGSAVINGKLYLFGGGAPFPTTITTTQIYDPSTNSWSSGANMNVNRVWFYGGAGNCNIVAPGGDQSPGIPINDNEQLTISNCGGSCPPGPWSVATPYPTTIVRYGFAQTATHFYVFGGVSNGTRVNNVNRMDISTGMWQPRAPMPFTSEAPTCALMASTGLVYCAEGDTGSGFASYNIATDTWTSLAAIPGGDHYGSASGAFNGKVFVAGGTTGIVNTVQVYDVASNTWSAGTAAPTAFLLAGYQQVGQYLYVVGGFDTTSPDSVRAGLSSVLHRAEQSNVPSANSTLSSRLDMSSAPGAWSTGPAFTQSRADFGLAYNAGTNKLYALGGDASGGGFFDSTNLVDELSVGAWPAGTWVASPPNLIAPNRQANQAGFSNGGTIWSVGGLNGATFQFLAEVQKRTVSCGPTPNSAVSRLNHTGVGDFDIALPLTGTPGVECRKKTATNDHSMVVTFASSVTVTGVPQAQVTSGTGCVGTGGVCNGTVSVSGAVVTIPLTNVADDQIITVQLNGVSDGATIGTVVIPMNMVLGDTNGNGVANSSDIAQTKGRIGFVVDGTNFRSDVNANGAINSTDVTIIKQQ